MPSPVITCLLVAALIVGLSSVVAGAAIAVLCGVIEFFLPLLASDE